MASIDAMDVDTDVYYVRFGENLTDQEGLLTTFPKSILNDMPTLKNMRDDLGDDVGMKETPFVLEKSTVPPVIFKTIIFIQKTIAQNPENYANASMLQKFIWELIKTKENHYAYLAQLIKSGSFLDINPQIMSALMLCATKPLHEKSETADRALQAGLHQINTLPNEYLYPIKKTLIEAFFGIAQKSAHRRIHTFPISEKVNSTGTYSMVTNQFYRYYDFGFDGTFVCTLANKPSQFSVYKIESTTLQRKDHAIAYIEQLIPHIVYKIKDITSVWHVTMVEDRWDPNRWGKNSVDEMGDVWKLLVEHLPFRIRISPNGRYACCFLSIADTDEVNKHSVSLIVDLQTNKSLLIPNALTFFSNFTDPADKKEKLFCTYGSDTEGGGKLIVIDPDFTVTVVNDRDYDYVRNAYLLNNTMLIYTADCLNRDLDGWEIRIHDFQSNANTSVDNIGDYEYGRYLFAWAEQGLLKILGEEDINFYLHTVAINFDQKNQRVFKQIGESKHLSFGGELALPNCTTTLLPYPYNNFHADWGEKLINRNNGAIELIRFNEKKNAIEIMEWMSKAYVDTINNNYADFFELPIEQLYVLEHIAHQIASKKFTKLSPVEKQQLEAMPAHVREMCYDFFPQIKPVKASSFKGFYSIVKPEKTGEYTAPLKGYIEKQQRGSKRSARGTPEGQRSAKKQKREPVESDEESEAEDEQTLDESEEDKE